MGETTPEQWRPVAGFEGSYEVSDLGRVRSLDRLVAGTTPNGIWCRRRIRGRILKQTPMPSGYMQVHLGHSSIHYVHTLVAEAFAGPRPEGMECRHGPGGNADNRAVNLSWGTRSQNLGADRIRDGTDYNGDRAPMAKLTWEQVDEIRRRLPVVLRTGPRTGQAKNLPTQRDLAAEYGVAQQTIGEIIAGKSWRPEFRRPAS